MTGPARTLAVVAHGAQDLRVEEMPTAAPEPDEAVIRIAYGGICGSDLHYWQHGAAGESILRSPMRLGHEASGTVLVAAEDGSRPAAGTPITVHPATPGGTGAKYPADRPNLSPGCTYLGSAAQFPHSDGLFASHVAVPPGCCEPCLLVSICERHHLRSQPALRGMPWHGPVRSRTSRPL